MNLQRLVRVVAIGVTCAVWLFSLMPVTPTIPGGDKLHHLLAYAGLMLMWRLAIPAATVRTQATLAALIMLMGIAIEFAQALTPHRTFEWADAAANAVGVFIGWIVATLWLRFAPKRGFTRAV
ncbi:MAG: VanZ family protein [Burkholderiales bacterium]